MVKGYLYGFEPALCPPGSRFGPLTQDAQTSAPGPAGVRLVGQPPLCSQAGRGPRRVAPVRRAGRSTSSTNKAPQNAVESLLKPAAPAQVRVASGHPPETGAGRHPPRRRPRSFLCISWQGLTCEFPQNPLGGVMPRPVPGGRGLAPQAPSSRS